LTRSRFDDTILIHEVSLERRRLLRTGCFDEVKLNCETRTYLVITSPLDRNNDYSLWNSFHSTSSNVAFAALRRLPDGCYPVCSIIHLASIKAIWDPKSNTRGKVDVQRQRWSFQGCIRDSWGLCERISGRSSHTTTSELVYTKKIAAISASQS